jgi:transcription initiation factor IIF auxiliary subunit
LHPTFPNPVRNVSDRASNFTLNASGWGTFEVGALVHLRDGTTTILSHELDFSRS